MTAPTYTQQQAPQLFGQTPGYDPFNAYGTSLPGGFGQQQPGGFGQQQPGGFGQQQPGGFGQQQPGGFGQQHWGQQGGDPYTLAWQLLSYAQQSIQLAQQIVMHSIQQLPYQTMNQNQWQTPFGPRGFQRQPMAW